MNALAGLYMRDRLLNQRYSSNKNTSSKFVDFSLVKTRCRSSAPFCATGGDPTFSTSPLWEITRASTVFPTVRISMYIL